MTSDASTLDKALNQEIDELVKTQMQKSRIPGLALCMANGSQIVKIACYGLSNLELSVPVTPQTLFQIGSMGKSLVAAAVMYLAQDGALRLDDPVRRHLPNAPSSWSEITIRHLLAHTSGIGGAYPFYDLRRDYTNEELLEIAFAVPLRFRAGDKWEYMNTGYLVLGILIGQVAGKHYQEVLKERIFEPLGMQTAQLVDQDDVVPNRAAGYRLDGKTLKNQEWVSGTFNSTADGSLCASILDMACWLGARGAKTAISADSLRQMWTPTTLNDGTTADYGLGWELKKIDGRQVAQHGGDWQGFTGHMACSLDNDINVVILGNLAGAPISNMVHHLTGLYTSV